MRSSIFLIFVSFIGLLTPQEALAQLLEPQCGRTGVVDYIKGGEDAMHGAFPWMAFLYRNENEFVCGGSLIHKRFVLTAAHCIVNADYLSVRLGEYYSATRAASSRVYSVTLAIRNRLYSKAEHVHDIGVLRLDRAVQFNANIRPVCIFTDRNRVPHVSSYSVSGWGTTDYSRTSAVLQTLTLQDMDAGQCYNNMGYNIGAGQICAAHSTGDTCSGDSGGPLVQMVNVDGTDRFVQFGLVSFGLSVCRGPGVYTRVHHYVDWILRVVNYGLTH